MPFINHFESLLKRRFLNVKPFYKPFQIGFLDKSCFKIMGMWSLKPFWWKHFANTLKLSRRLVLEACFCKDGIICKTFEIQDRSDFEVGWNWCKFLKIKTFVNTHFFLWKVSNQELFKMRFCFQKYALFFLSWIKQF